MRNIRMVARATIVCCAVAYGIFMWHARATDRALADQILTTQKNGAALSEKMRQACEKAGVKIDDKSTNVVCEDNSVNGTKVD